MAEGLVHWERFVGLERSALAGLIFTPRHGLSIDAAARVGDGPLGKFVEARVGLTWTFELKKSSPRPGG